MSRVDNVARVLKVALLGLSHREAGVYDAFFAVPGGETSTTTLVYLRGNVGPDLSEAVRFEVQIRGCIASNEKTNIARSKFPPISTL